MSFPRDVSKSTTDPSPRLLPPSLRGVPNRLVAMGKDFFLFFPRVFFYLALVGPYFPSADQRMVVSPRRNWHPSLVIWRPPLPFSPSSPFQNPPKSGLLNSSRMERTEDHELSPFGPLDSLFPLSGCLTFYTELDYFWRCMGISTPSFSLSTSLRSCIPSFSFFQGRLARLDHLRFPLFHPSKHPLRR